MEEKMETTSSSGGGENYYWGKLMQNLHHLFKLQKYASRAQINARQKRREASFKRQDSWFKDAEFMWQSRDGKDSSGSYNRPNNEYSTVIKTSLKKLQHTPRIAKVLYLLRTNI